MHLLVIVVGDDVDGQLEPYQEGRSNPRAEFDWYQVGGRFADHLVLKPGRAAWDGHADAECDGDEDGPEGCDQALKGDIDFEAMARRAAPDAVVFDGEWVGPWWAKDGLTEEAARRWDAWCGALFASLPEDALLTVVDCHV